MALYVRKLRYAVITSTKRLRHARTYQPAFTNSSRGRAFDKKINMKIKRKR